MKGNYNPEIYWSEVAERIEERDGKNVIAGDDEPYYRYKRERFLKLLRKVKIKNKSVLEIGCGPGGNLSEILRMQPSRLVGIDISSKMVDLARLKLPTSIEVLKTDGTTLPFSSSEFEVSFTATVLQHTTDESNLKYLMAEMARVASERIYLFERIEQSIKGDELCLGRPTHYYDEIMRSNNFQLVSTEAINVRTSYYVSGAIRKLFNSKDRKEGEPLSSFSITLQKLSLPLTKFMDRIFKSSKDVCKLEFQRF